MTKRNSFGMSLLSGEELKLSLNQTKGKALTKISSEQHESVTSVEKRGNFQHDHPIRRTVLFKKLKTFQ